MCLFILFFLIIIIYFFFIIHLFLLIKENNFFLINLNFFRLKIFVNKKMNLKLYHFNTTILRTTALSILILFLCHFTFLNAQNDFVKPNTSELIFYKNEKSNNKRKTKILITNVNESKKYLNNSTLIYREKRQWNNCPTGCYSPCSNNGNCPQKYQVATVCVLGCCCPAPQTNLSCKKFMIFIF